MAHDGRSHDDIPSRAHAQRRKSQARTGRRAPRRPGPLVCRSLAAPAVTAPEALEPAPVALVELGTSVVSVPEEPAEAPAELVVVGDPVAVGVELAVCPELADGAEVPGALKPEPELVAVDDSRPDVPDADEVEADGAVEDKVDPDETEEDEAEPDEMEEDEVEAVLGVALPLLLELVVVDPDTSETREADVELTELDDVETTEEDDLPEVLVALGLLDSEEDSLVVDEVRMVSDDAPPVSCDEVTTFALVLRSAAGPELVLAGLASVALQ